MCAEVITDEDETAEAEVKSMNWETHSECMMEALNQKWKAKDDHHISNRQITKKGKNAENEDVTGAENTRADVTQVKNYEWMADSNNQDRRTTQKRTQYGA